ncbi:hypothetical protein DWG18_00380 [Lysobacter sp. TY2-98]|uniref:MaoC/PaaZ C-terminal domain-containing protein n=1 Tax=Lysobacter sp. TY2-98 TaxID=2290922 RepID=UPI000E20AA0D|nr:MaoC/PaaZ C-terminal domain-containing protein [Lysobacter sp. TY2-98]AXK70894.1 hypothetical protein DWG18_00380 [Lysobacter sp. TY2-98]
MSAFNPEARALRTLDWNADSGSERQLVAAVLADRIDEVRVHASAADAASRLASVGFPLKFADAAAGGAHTLTLRPLLTWSEQTPLTREFVTTGADIEAYGRASGDMNPLHFDDAFAQAAGFRRRIAHGMLFNGWLTRVLGTELPGQGSIISQTRSLFFAPVYPDEVCTVRLSVGYLDTGRGRYLMVAQLFDPEGLHCCIAYTDIVRRAAAR